MPSAEYSNGRAAKGYTCNAVEVSHFSAAGGFKTLRYTDRHGRTCAYYDGPSQLTQTVPGGVHVLDMSNSSRPVETDSLFTPAMDSPHESLLVHQSRGLLAAGMGSPSTNPGIVDVYDISQDCRHPVLQSSSPLGILGHESAFSPDGRTLWISTSIAPGVTAIDVTNPKQPSIVWHSFTHWFHGMSLNATGTRLYGAQVGSSWGLTILDVSQVQSRVLNAAVTTVSTSTWPEVSIPQNTTRFTFKNHSYLLEFDEYASGDNVGAVRIINIDDDRKPRVVSHLRLEVNQPKARATDQKDDPGASNASQGYAAHYCAVPRVNDPPIVACSFILSGLRVFNISDLLHPREVAYFNRPTVAPVARGAFAMAAPTFDLKRREIWYTDLNAGFFAVRLTNDAWPKGL